MLKNNIYHICIYNIFSAINFAAANLTYLILATFLIIYRHYTHELSTTNIKFFSEI